MAAFLVKLVKLVAQCLLIGRRIPADEGERDNVVEMKRVRNRHEVAALELHYERLVAARLINVVHESETLQNVQGYRRIAHPVRVPPYRPLARGLYDAFHPVGNEPSFRIRVQRVAVLPGAPVSSSLVSTSDDLPCQVGGFIDR